MTKSDEQQGEAPDFSHEEEGYHQALGKRQLQMIAIGGAIGTGLFLGAGGRLATAGPALAVVYAICGFFVFLILRALGELVLHRPSSGSFVSYAREFYGEKAAYVSGWMYFVNWAFTSIVDVTAIALYMKFWSVFAPVPQWLIALIALVVVLSANLVSVKLFGELEFWFALVKVLALVGFLVIGTIFLAARYPIQGHETGFSVITDNGGLLPNGLLAAVVVTQGVVFAYAATELVGTAAGETENPEKIMPRAINSVIARIAVFYVGSLVLLGLLLPYTAYHEGTSPFVTFFDSIGIPYAGTVMNLVVLTAALSSLNAGLYSTGRILRSMSMNGSAPEFTGRMNSSGVPYGGIGLTAVITLLGVGLNAVVPDQAFEIVLNIASLGILASWATIVLCQMRFVKITEAGVLQRPGFRLPGSPWTGWAVLVFLAAVLVLMAFDYPVGTYTVALIPVLAILLVIGWYFVRDRVNAAAENRMGWTGQYPVRAERPYPGDGEQQ